MLVARYTSFTGLLLGLLLSMGMGMGMGMGIGQDCCQGYCSGYGVSHRRARGSDLDRARQAMGLAVGMGSSSGTQDQAA